MVQVQRSISLLGHLGEAFFAQGDFENARQTLEAQKAQLELQDMSTLAGNP